MDLAAARTVRAVLCDVDGVLSAGELCYDDRGGEAKTFHVRDGSAIKLAIAAGLRIGVISGRDSVALRRRADELGCQPQLLGVSDKLVAATTWLAEVGLDWPQLCVVGDDLPDLALLRRAGVGVAVADAEPRLRCQADWITRRAGGRGAVAELLLRLLRLQGRLRGSPADAPHG